MTYLLRRPRLDPYLYRASILGKHQMQMGALEDRIRRESIKSKRGPAREVDRILKLIMEEEDITCTHPI